jgi:hypothetical protein
VAGEAETGETQKAWDDCKHLCRDQRGDWRLPETAETSVVWLITQRQLANSGLTYPEDGVAESASERQSAG